MRWVKRAAWKGRRKYVNNFGCKTEESLEGPTLTKGGNKKTDVLKLGREFESYIAVVKV
jgi:hypothetical protein